MQNNMAETVLEFAIPLILKVVSVDVVDFEPVETYTNTDIMGTIVPAKPRDLQGYEVQFGIEYYKVHTTSKVSSTDLLSYHGKEYKAISISNYSDYGFYKCIFEEVKQ